MSQAESHLVKARSASLVKILLQSQNDNNIHWPLLSTFYVPHNILSTQNIISYQFSSLNQSCPTLCDPMNLSNQAYLSVTNSQSLPKPTSIESVMPFNHLILCRPLLLLPSIFPSIRVFSNESALHIRWPEYWSFSFNINPSSEHPGLIFFRMDWLDLLQSKGLSRVFSNTTLQKHQFFCAQLSL